MGTAEIKLHDDAGDIEVWLTQEGHGGEPWWLPVATSLAMNFPAAEKTGSASLSETMRGMKMSLERLPISSFRGKQERTRFG